MTRVGVFLFVGLRYTREAGEGRAPPEGCRRGVGTRRGQLSEAVRLSPRVAGPGVGHGHQEQTGGARAPLGHTSGSPGQGRRERWGSLELAGWSRAPESAQGGHLVAVPQDSALPPVTLRSISGE